MANFLDEIRSVKLRKSAEPIRDFSDAKLAGFMSESDIGKYRHAVIDCNMENWYTLIRSVTFETRFEPIRLDDVKMFIKIYERIFRDKQEHQEDNGNWKSQLNDDERRWLVDVEGRLEECRARMSENGNEPVFVKTSCRSAKDSPTVGEAFRTLYGQYLSQLEDEQKNSENEQIICILKAAFESLKVYKSERALEMLIRSERIYQDMLLASEVPERFNQNFVIRKFVHIDVDMEFRGFVHNRRLTALSQYNYLIYSKRLNENRQLVQKKIVDFFDQKVNPLLTDKFLDNYVIDFALVSSNVRLIDNILFSAIFFLSPIWCFLFKNK